MDVYAKTFAQTLRICVKFARRSSHKRPLDGTEKYSTANGLCALASQASHVSHSGQDLQVPALPDYQARGRHSDTQLSGKAWTPEDHQFLVYLTRVGSKASGQSFKYYCVEFRTRPRRILRHCAATVACWTKSGSPNLEQKRRSFLSASCGSGLLLSTLSTGVERPWDQGRSTPVDKVDYNKPLPQDGMLY